MIVRTNNKKIKHDEKIAQHNKKQKKYIQKEEEEASHESKPLKQKVKIESSTQEHTDFN